MLKEVDEQSKEFNLNEFEELTLDSIQFQKFTQELKEKLEKFPNLCSLTMNDCKLNSLENFPALPKLLKAKKKKKKKKKTKLIFS